jgi:excisionase family DNA binding protein
MTTDEHGLTRTRAAKEHKRLRGADGPAHSALGDGVLGPGQKYVTRVELAQILRISVRKVDSMIAEREIPVLRLGKSVRFRWCEVEAHLEAKCRVEAEGTDEHGRTRTNTDAGQAK